MKLGTESIHTSWVLGRNGQRLTCHLIAEEAFYVLRLTQNGQRLLEERCEGPHQALARSVQAFTALAARGWLLDESVN